MDTARKFLQIVSLICFLCFFSYIAIISLQWRFDFSYDGLLLCIIILSFLHILIYYLSPTRYKAKYEKRLAFLWIAVNLSFIVDKGFVNPTSILFAQDTNHLSFVQFLNAFSYPWLFQTIGVWEKHNILFQNVTGNLGIFLITGIILSKYVPCLLRWKRFLVVQLILSISLALLRVMLHTGIFSTDQVILWVLSGLIGHTIFMFIHQKKITISKKTT